jgi:hypothetical protein
MPNLSDTIRHAQQDRDRSEAGLALESRAAKVAEQASKLAILLSIVCHNYGCTTKEGLFHGSRERTRCCSSRSSANGSGCRRCGGE